MNIKSGKNDMTKYSKFDEIKIKLAMDHRGLSREEAIIELKLRKTLKGDEQRADSQKAKKTGRPKRRRHDDLDIMTAEEFFGDVG